MRFTAAVIATLAIASIGAQALPTPDEPTYKPVPTDKYKPTATPKAEPTDKYKPVPTDKYKPVPTDKYKPEPPKHDDKKEPEYELVCEEFAFFHNWDIYDNNLKSGPTKGKWIYDCAKDCLKDKDCDATVNLDGYCYPKSLDYFEIHNLYKCEGRDLAIRGSCEDLQENYKKTKCYPDGFLDCCYDKKICKKVYKDGKDHKDDDHKKDDHKKDDYKKDDYKKDDYKKDDYKKDDHKKDDYKKDDYKKDEHKKEEPKKEEKKW